MLLFPSLQNKKWVKINLNDLAEHENYKSPNPLVDPNFCESWVNQQTRKINADFSYGGYLEKRNILWKDHYLELGVDIHLGIDYNVPTSTLVKSPINGRVVMSEKEEAGILGGWGGWIIVELDQYQHSISHLIFGHMSHKDLPNTGDIIKKGEHIGIIGDHFENGGWFAHLHLQALSLQCWNIWKDQLDLIDGYAKDHKDLSLLYPNPELILK